MKYKKYISIAIIILLFFILFKHSQYINFEKINEVIESAGIFAPIVFLILMILAITISPIPASPLVIIGSKIFGVWSGMMLSLVSATIGAVIAFLISRKIGPYFFSKNPKYSYIKNKLPENSTAFTIFLMRIPPSPTFDIVSYLAGLTKIHLWKFALATFLGMIPVVFTTSVLGSQIPNQYFWLIIIIIFTVWLIINLIKNNIIMRKIIFILIIITILIASYFIYISFFITKTPGGIAGVIKNQVPINDIEIVTTNLYIPWEIEFLPSGEMLVTERPGNLLKIKKDKTIIKIEGVVHTGEGGLQGLAVHPDFNTNNFIYLYLTTKSNNKLINKVNRYKLIDNQLSEQRTIIDNIPGANYHDGGRIKFGPDKKLYVTTGDAGQSNLAQDLNYLGGKILRVNDDGSIPNDNPFVNSPIYSYGHRNPQGLTWDKNNNLWSTEHGRSVPLSGYDELNIIYPGKNYGWTDIEGDKTAENKIRPIINSGSNFTWAPAGAVYFDESIFFAGLKGEALYEYNINSKELKNHLFQEFGRLRAVVIGPDNFIYISTSNTDGRGEIKNNDDKIIKINPNIFN